MHCASRINLRLSYMGALCKMNSNRLLSQLMPVIVRLIKDSVGLKKKSMNLCYQVQFITPPNQLLWTRISIGTVIISNTILVKMELLTHIFL